MWFLFKYFKSQTNNCFTLFAFTHVYYYIVAQQNDDVTAIIGILQGTKKPKLFSLETLNYMDMQLLIKLGGEKLLEYNRII